MSEAWPKARLLKQLSEAETSLQPAALNPAGR